MKTRISFIAGGLALALAAAAVHAEPTAADRSSAKLALEEGNELAAKGNHADALDKFRAAYGFAPTPVTGLALGKGLLAVGKLVEARETFAAVEALPKKTTESKASDDARAEATRLKDEVTPRIPLVVLTVTGLPSGATPRVSLDGRDVPAATLGVERRIDPGEHTLVASAANAPEEKRVFKISEKEHASVALELHPKTVVVPAEETKAAPAEGKSSTPPTDSSPPTVTAGPWGTIGLVTAGVGLGTAGLGTWLYLSGRSTKSELAAEGCTRDRGGCGNEGSPKFESYTIADGKTKTGTVLLIIGSAIAVGGAVFFFASPSDAKARNASFRVERIGVGVSTLIIGGTF